ncbi:MAG: hypothetical protein JF616_08105 [Fibrobacteres bacterium]|nr:hypothetical protein [Fibrobacterota bacterium]
MHKTFPSRIRAGFVAGLLAIPFTASAQNHDCLEVVSQSVDFGGVWIGNEGLGYLQVRNACERAITITKITVSKPVFRTSSPVPVNLTGQTSAWLEFRLRPKSPGSVAGSACLYSNSGSKPACVSLNGTGVVPPTMSVSPTSLRLTQAAGTQGTASLQIANSGGDRLEAIVDFTGPVLPRPAAGWKVAFVQTPTPEGYGQFIDAVRTFSNVDTLDVFDGSAGVPTLAYLNRFDVVMVEAGGAWADPVATGDSLAAYLLSGGRMVYFSQALSDNPARLGGLIQNFTTIQQYQTAFAGQSGTLADHPINAGVSSFWAASAMATYRVQDNSSVSLGNYANGYITGAVNIQYPLALLNFHPGDQNWSGDVPRLVANALDYLGTQTSWMTTNGTYPYPGTDIFTVGAGATRALNMNIWTYRMAPGTYQGEIRLLHDDPAQASPYVVPVTLTVTP